MEEPTLETLIDQYLLGTISPGDKTRLEQLMATESSVAALVRDSQRAYKALLLERNRLLKEKLRQLDKDDLHEQRILPRKLGLIFFFTMVVILVYTLAAMYYSPKWIALRNLSEYPMTGRQANTLEGMEADWQLAKTAFHNNDFEAAIQKYVILAGDRDTPGHYVARWNILMAQLAAEGPTSAWQLAMETFAREAPPPLSANANSLSGMFKHTYYKLFFSPLKDKFSCLKPRLI